MPGFLGGGGSGSSGTGGEIRFPKEFIDPVTKLRISQPENLIDTDFEYGLQPTKWETVELINNTPSFFSKSGDTTIPGILSISTNTGTREITVVTATDHGLAVGIPINVTGTKSVTADGSYIINSIPNTTTFTYLCKDIQQGNNAIEDLYTSIITGEFFQGSQIRIADAEGIVTDGEAISTLTVKTDSTHGFGLKTPFYFLNLNSTISQEFEASNTAAKSFDSSNSATAQTFDGSNTLSTFNIDWSNSATIGGTTSTISTVSTANNTITVSHGAENFANQPLGTPLYYNLTTTASSGYFNTNPRGVVFLKTINALNIPAGESTFQVSEVPDGNAITIVSSMSGTFQLANQARTFAGNNLNNLTQTDITVIKDSPILFDGQNQGYVGDAATNGLCTVEGYSDTILVSVSAGGGLDYYVGAMVKYETTGSSASGLVDDRTYFIASFVSGSSANQYRITIKEFPNSASALAPTGGTGIQTFTKIGVSVDKDIVHVKNSNYSVGDMLEYSFPAGAGGRFGADIEKSFYFVTTAYDTHNYALSDSLFSPVVATGGVVTDQYVQGQLYRIHSFSTVGSNTFTVTSSGTVDFLLVGGGASGGFATGGGGAGGVVLGRSFAVTAQSYSLTVGNGAKNRLTGGGSYTTDGTNGQNTVGFGYTATGGGGGAARNEPNAGPRVGLAGGSGGGGSHSNIGGNNVGGSSTQNVYSANITGYGNAGGRGRGNVSAPEPSHGGGGGGGAGSVGSDFVEPSAYGGHGGSGRYFGHLFTNNFGENGYFAGGGGGNSYYLVANSAGRGGIGGGGKGSHSGPTSVAPDDGVNGTGGGGGAASFHDGATHINGVGGSGIILVRYPIEARSTSVISATGGTETTITEDGINYRVHSFLTPGTSIFTVSSAPATSNTVEYLIVAGGGAGAGGTYNGGGGGAGGFLTGRTTISATSYSIVVGVGGEGRNTFGLNGGNSSALGLTAIGGGGGGQHPGGTANGQNGGSGGGGSQGGAPGGSGTPGQGNNGGGYWYAAGGGGGGAGRYGAVDNFSNRGSGNDPYRGRYAAVDGGIGRPSTIRTGSETYYAGGGGGGERVAYSVPQGRGGLGGGGNGGTDGGRTGSNGTANTGGGGGGVGGNTASSALGGSGGSGIVVIRYAIGVQ